MSESLADRLAAAIGADRVLSGDDRGHAHDEDLGRNPLGEPAAWVRPESTEHVAAVVAIARDTRTAIVPAHRRTTYWRPLAFERAIVVDATGLTAVGEVDTSARTLRCGAGATARAIDDALRATGHTLLAWPDAYGDTSIGSMIATAFSSGIGMGIAGADNLVTGLAAVLGTGEVVRAGAGEVLDAGGFERGGLPDLAGLLFGSEGALGIVTEVVVRARVRAHRAKLSFDVPGRLEACLAIATELRVPGLYETFRCVEHGTGPADAEITLTSPISREELDGRIRFVRRIAGKRVANLEALIEGPDGTDIPRFCGEAGEHWAHLRAGRFCGVDAIVPYGAAADALAASHSVTARARAVPHIDARRALYFAPDFVNLGLHWMLDADTDQATADRLVEVGVDDLSDLPIIPYRWGRVWTALSGKLDPGYRAAIAAVKRALDPDGIMNPGVSVFGVERVTAEPSRLLAAMRRAGDTPALMEAFDAAATGGDDASVDFFETSARVGEALAPHRATYYFDVARRGPDRAASANERFATAAEACGFALPPAFAALLAGDALADPCVLQIVLGIDAGSPVRFKYYLIFMDNPHEIIDTLSNAVGIDLAAGVDPSAVYIAGVDLAVDGPSDLKAYVRLRDDRVAATLRRPAVHRALIAGSRYVVFQQCATTDRRQMYFHAEAPGVIGAELDAAPAAATAELRARVAAMNAGADTLEPWILAYPYADGALDRSRYTAYFHFAG